MFAGLPQPCEVGRYHSLIAQPESLPPMLEVTARTPEGEIMGVRHRELKVEGVQFHPESVLTPEGPKLHGEFPQFTTASAARSSAGAVHAALRELLEKLLERTGPHRGRGAGAAHAR